jgi:hypothetical protein
MLHLAKALLKRDTALSAACSAFSAGTFSRDDLFMCLGEVYRDYAFIEHCFETVRTGTDLDALEVYRHAR